MALPLEAKLSFYLITSIRIIIRPTKNALRAMRDKSQESFALTRWGFANERHGVLLKSVNCLGCSQFVSAVVIVRIAYFKATRISTTRAVLNQSKKDVAG